MPVIHLATSRETKNIMSKTDADNYVYHATKLNAVAYITNPAGAQTPPYVISQNQQDIIYTAFQKIATIAKGNNNLTYTYGSDYQHTKSVLLQNGATVETKYYLGDYERQIRNGATNDIIYVSGSNGLCSIIVNGTVYYTYNDYPGSILTVTDASGNVTAEQNFDAWGRKRNTTDWTYSNISDNLDWLYRGYTTHEYLKEFSLINMNGRVYDPIQGRMMSPDILINDMFSTQDYNMYSYVVNNPLKYVDLSGYSENLPPVIVGGGGSSSSSKKDPSKLVDVVVSRSLKSQQFLHTPYWESVINGSSTPTVFGEIMGVPDPDAKWLADVVIHSKKKDKTWDNANTTLGAWGFASGLV